MSRNNNTGSAAQHHIGPMLLSRTQATEKHLDIEVLDETRSSHRHLLMESMTSGSSFPAQLCDPSTAL